MMDKKNPSDAKWIDSDRLYRLLAENVMDIIWTMDLKLNLTYITPSVEKCLGFTVAEALSQRLDESLTPTSLDATLGLYHTTLKDIREKRRAPDEPVNIQLEFRHKNGGTVWTESIITPIWNESGELEGIIGVSREISEKKQAEKIIRESELRYRQLFDHAPAGIYEIDYRTGKIISVNHVICEYMGYTREEMLQLPAFDILVEESQLRFTARLEKILKGEPVPDTVEYRIRSRDGTERDVILNTRFVYEDQQLVGATVVVYDISERKRSEEALQASEARYRTILESIEEGYFETDLGGRLAFVNDAACKITGYTQAELIGARYHEYTDATTAQQLREHFQKVYQDGTGTKNRLLELIHKDNVPIVIELSTSLLCDAAGKPVGFRGLFRDVSEKIHADREREKLKAQLQQAHKMEAIGTLAGGIAHDFNNILMGMQGNISLLLLKMGADDPAYEKLKNVEQYIASGSDLTKQLLGFARGGKYEVKVTDPNELIRRTAEMFGRTRKEIQIHTEDLGSTWTVEVDPGQMTQVFLNLFVNAWQAMPTGGKLLLSSRDLEFQEAETTTPGLSVGRFVAVSVKDTGIGMDEEIQSKIFDPFFTTKEMSRGTGLGLASAYGIIKSHSGGIQVNSRKGMGTQFTIFLPASDKTVEQEIPLPDSLLTGTETVLLADDEEMVLDVGQEILEELGYRVLTARSGREALARFQEHRDRIDLVIIDMIMPDMGGGETFDRLRTLDPEVKVLLSSGYSIEGAAADIMNRGCNGFLHKPFGIHAFSKKIREVLDR